MRANPQQRIPFSRQIRWRLTAIFLAIAILPVIFVSVVILRQEETQLRQLAFNQLESISILKAQQVEDWLREGREELKLIRSIENLDGIFDSESLQANVNANFATIAANSDTIENVFVYDRDGEIVVASDEATIGRVVRRQPYFELSLLEDYLQPPYFDVSSGSLAIVATAPLLEEGTLIGVVAIRFNTDELSRIMLERTGLGQSGETYLVSSENNYLLTPSRFEEYAQNRAYTSFGIEQALAGETGLSVYEDYRDPPVSVFGVYTWLPDLELALLTEIDETEALQAVSQAQTSVVILALLTTFVVTMMGFLVASRISAPIEQLSQTANEIRTGNPDKRVVVERNDEIGVLATAFNAMVDAVEAQQIQLRSARDEALAAQRIANENSRLKSEFLSTMSHELRTPMNAIEGFTGIILKRMGGADYNPKTERYLKKIQTNSRRLLSLINDFLDLSRIESGRLELANLPVSVRDMARTWEDSLSSLAESKGLTFEVKVDPSLPETIIGDEESISKIVVNLVGNAIKFTETGGVTVSLHRREELMELEVADTGIGIPPHARDFIFDEFRQVDQSSKREYGGTGLGLAIVQKLTRAMNGKISLQSEVGVGSTFSIAFPIQTEETLPEGVA